MGYIAPEQDANQITPAVDLYGLGATLIYLLTGKEPDTFYRLGDQEFRIIVEDVPHLNLDLAHIIQKLTHPHPEQRYASAGLVATALQDLQL